MDQLLRAYLDAHPTHHEAVEQWPVQGKLRVRLGLSPEFPPAHASSVLAVIFDAKYRVLYLWPNETTGSIAQVLIGGRAKAGETPEEAVIREAGEETGWRIELVGMIAFRHFFHLEPRVEKTDRPYPDFIQPIFAARAVAFDPTFVISGDRIPAEFLDFSLAESKTEPAQRPLLLAARAAL